MHPEKEYIINSLGNRIALLSVQIAERDAIIAGQQKEIEQLRKEQIDKLEEDAE